MTVLAMTIQAGVFFWVAASLALAGAWCAAVLIAEKRNERLARKRRARRGGYLKVGPYNRRRLP